jgi:hypothetical protein
MLVALQFMGLVLADFAHKVDPEYRVVVELRAMSAGSLRRSTAEAAHQQWRKGRRQLRLRMAVVTVVLILAQATVTINSIVSAADTENQTSSRSAADHLASLNYIGLNTLHICAIMHLLWRGIVLYRCLPIRSRTADALVFRYISRLLVSGLVSFLLMFERLGVSFALYLSPAWLAGFGNDNFVVVALYVVPDLGTGIVLLWLIAPRHLFFCCGSHASSKLILSEQRIRELELQRSGALAAKAASVGGMAATAHGAVPDPAVPLADVWL